jgi:ectoine hydroxylase-related dioxygenase (phytanoyl-CoA dioxygenase family)
MNNTDYKNLLDTSGFVVIPNLISASECDLYKVLLEADYENYAKLYQGAASVPLGDLANKSGEKVVFNLHNKHLSWFKLFQHPQILLLLDHLLKAGSYNNVEPYYLNNISARCPLKDHPGQQLHLDSNLPGINYCIVVNVLWMLDDFTNENGATRVVPGSHKWKEFACDGLVHEDEIRITGSRGSALIFNANLWHGGTMNSTEQSRWAVALGYARWSIKPSFDFMQNTPDYIYKKLTLQQKELLGFRLVPPKDEFTRLRRRSEFCEEPYGYQLSKIDLAI